MSNNHDVVLQNLFEEAQQNLDGSDFTPRVIKRTYGLVIRIGVMVLSISLVLLAGIVVLGISPFELAQEISAVMNISLFDLGEGWGSWILAPVNNIAGVLILGAKSMRMLYKKVIRIS